MTQHHYLIALLFLFAACTSDTTTEEAASSNLPTEEAPVAPPVEEIPISTEAAKLIVNLENLRLRASPGEKGKEVGRLAKGSLLEDAGELSDFTTRLKLRGVQFDEPWIKVKTETGTEGWVYGGGVNFAMENPTDLTNKLMEYRLRTLFKGLTPRILDYRKKYKQCQNSESFAEIYREGGLLRDTLVRLLEDKITVEDYKQLPDLFWLEQAMPGYVPQLVAEGTLYYLFQDYSLMETQAKKTKGLEDDDYIELCRMVHSFDSVESFFPSWFLQTWDYGGNSLLGQGVHDRLLTQMDAVLKRGSLFETEVLDLKNRILNDISWVENSYWEPTEKIKAELDRILAADLELLTAEDITALETRRKMFDDVKGNKIEVNLKAG